jgi:hypothetical protein
MHDACRGSKEHARIARAGFLAEKRVLKLPLNRSITFEIFIIYIISSGALERAF